MDYAPNRQYSVSRRYTGNVLQSTHYYSGDYEKEITGGVTKEFDYIYSPEGLAAIAVKTGGMRTMYYAHTDHLGSLWVITDANKNIVSRYRYDAWGKRTFGAGNNNITNRGFTGHEHLPEFGLINMNARMYDPVLGRFLSPAPFVQAPDFSQSYNNSYALNNPLIYTDPDGEFLWTNLTGVFDFIGTAFFKGGLDPTNKSARQEAWRNYDPTASWSNPNKAWQIDMGLFKGDFKKIASRFTWELPQTLIGYAGSGAQNLFGWVHSVTRWCNNR